MEYIDYLKKRGHFKVASEQYRHFLKATQGAPDSARDNIIDHHVMDFLHHLIHDIQDGANSHNTARVAIDHHDAKRSVLAAQKDGMERKVKSILTKIVKELSEFKISDPDSLPHIQHIVENHPVIHSVLQELLDHDITIEAATRKVIDNIDKEKVEERSNLNSVGFQKSSASNFGMFGLYSFPSYPVASSASSLSRFRPTPPLLMNTFETPDELFIKMLLRDRKEKDELRPAVPADMSHAELAKKIGIPEYIIAARPISEPTPEAVQKSIPRIEYIKARMRKNAIPQKIADAYASFRNTYRFKN